MKSKINIFYSLSICVLILIFAGCFKDKGNYELHEINQVNFVKNGSDTIKVNQFDTLKLATELSQSLQENIENLSFKWSVYLYNPPITGLIDEVISIEKDLNVQFGLRPDKYTLLYTVTDKNTGVSFFKKYYLEVSTTLSEGWLLVGENKEGKTDIDLLHPNGYTVKNLLSTANPRIKLPENIHTVRVLTTFFGGSQNIFILAKNDAIRVKYTDFTKVNSVKDWYIEKPSFYKPENYVYDQMGGNAFYIDNGKIFSNQVDFRFGAPVEEDHVFSNYVFSSQSGESAVLYDIKNKRFSKYANKIVSKFNNPVDAPFDMNNIGMDLIFAGKAPSNQYNYLMRDSLNNHFVYRIHFGGPIGKYPVNNAAKIMQATHAVFSGLYFHMYYAVGNEIYLLDIVNNISKLVYTLPQNEIITAFQMKQSFSSFVGFSDNNRTLAVGTYDGNDGKVYTFSIDNIGEFVNQTYTKLYSELDKPISLEYKNRK